MSISTPDYKTVGKNGQVSLGKDFAGQLVSIERFRPDAVVIKLGTFTSRFSEQLLAGNNKQQLQDAVEASLKTKPVLQTPASIDQLSKRLKRGK